MTRKLACLFMMVLALSALGCVSTRLASSWADPSAPSFKPSSVMVLILSRDEVTRRGGEDEVVRQLAPFKAVPAYATLTESQLRDQEGSNRILASKGIDAVLTFRFMGANAQANWAPGPVIYPTFWGYSHWAWGLGPYMWTDTVVRVETRLFDVKSDRLVWAGVSEAYNPVSPQTLIADVSRVTVENLKKAGLLK